MLSKCCIFSLFGYFLFVKALSASQISRRSDFPILKGKFLDEQFTWEERNLNSDKLERTVSYEAAGNLDSPTFVRRNDHKMLNSFGIDIFRMIKLTFLPIGFPNSVPQEYFQFQIWNLIQDLCSYLRGIMSTHAVLEGMGVGRSDISTVQATVQWILRDGASMLGGLLFTSFSSANFGQNVKSWRYFADLINNVGITLDMLAPLYKPHFLSIVCAASVCKALCGVAAGASGAAISEHWGKKNGNIADVLAKNGAQHTALSLFGLAVSVKFARYANASRHRIWFLYALLTAIHMGSNYKAMRVLALTSLNEIRLHMLIKQFLSHSLTIDLLSYTSSRQEKSEQELSLAVKEAVMRTNESHLYSPKAIADKEPILTPIIPLSNKFRHLMTSIRTALDVSYRKRYSESPRMRMMSFGKDEIKLWRPLSEAVQRYNSSFVRQTLMSYDGDSYVIFPDATRQRFFISYHRESTSMDHVKAVFETYLMIGLGLQGRTMTLLVLVNSLFPVFCEVLQTTGWDLSRIQLEPLGASVYS